MYSLKFGLAWFLGVIVTGFILSFLQGGETDWGLIITMSIAGFIGILIASAIKKALEKDKE
ncbi:hypothetical protein [Evansella clarkii]|uniref:hypothetical protein n=1 Tax=Evansella clarkii TaxID=79879 RepID=UPI000B4461E9|nr:hypothetical protein [Evansella clarkii]